MKEAKRPTFELVVQVRDFEGKPTGKTKVVSTNAPEELEDFLTRNSSKQNKNQNKSVSRKEKSRNEAWKEALFKELDKLSTLERGWDGRNSLPINSLIKEKAKRVISYVADVLTTKPRIAPTMGGGLQIEFGQNEKTLELEFVDPETIDYLFWDAPNGISEESSISADSLSKIRKLVQLI